MSDKQKIKDDLIKAVNDYNEIMNRIDESYANAREAGIKFDMIAIEGREENRYNARRYDLKFNE